MSKRPFIADLVTMLPEKYISWTESDMNNYELLKGK